MKGWAWFVAVQLICFLAMVVGWFLLLPLALCGAYFYATWTEDFRRKYHPRVDSISKWNWYWVDRVWGNWENGIDPGTQLVIEGKDVYMPGAPPWWRIYMWTAWRNSSNNLRWVFAWVGGPYYRWENSSWRGHIGFRPDTGWPVISANLNHRQEN
jgi:hypothetical protein